MLLLRYIFILFNFCSFSGSGESVHTYIKGQPKDNLECLLTGTTHLFVCERETEAETKKQRGSLPDFELADYA